jgi:hypothetical protein
MRRFLLVPISLKYFKRRWFIENYIITNEGTSMIDFTELATAGEEPPPPQGEG